MNLAAILNQENLERLAVQSNYDARQIAAKCEISLRQLQRIFKANLGCSPQSWLKEFKMFQAKQLLLTRKSVKQVAFELKYKHTSHFCSQFKLTCGLTPSEFSNSQSFFNVVQT